MKIIMQLFKEGLYELFVTTCIYITSFIEESDDGVWHHCANATKCPLRQLKVKITEDVHRDLDLCFWIWHEKLLDRTDVEWPEE